MGLSLDGLEISWRGEFFERGYGRHFTDYAKAGRGGGRAEGLDWTTLGAAGK